MNQVLYDTYLKILHDELVPAMGCTEPIALAYAGALARKTLNELPNRVELIVSGNILKNVKSVIVPNTDKRKGIKAALAAGIVLGDADKELEVLSAVQKEDLDELEDFLNRCEIKVMESKANCAFDIQVHVFKGDDDAYVRLLGSHTNIVSLRHNDEVIIDKSYDSISEGEDIRDALTVEKIVEFADEVRIEDIREVIERQINYNMAIAKAGMEGNYGANIGRILLRSYGNSVQNRAKAYAAAGSDARMNGCELPVVINSGSGNQGMSASIPVIVYGRECNVSDDLLYRALVISNLVTIHLKTGIGCLSAYCGATSAGAGAGAGICYLYNGGYKEIAHTIVNALAINSGMLCDGAKASCAAKIASAVESGLLGMQMYMHDSEFRCGDGLVANNVEKTIEAVSKIAREGMKATDEKIIDFMISND